jgi:DNA-binding transcriptional LysR family regulator
LGEHPLTPTPISVLYPKNRQLSPRVRVFIDWLVEVVSPKL